MSAPPLLPQIMAMIRMNKNSIWKSLLAAHVSTGLIAYSMYKIPVSEESKRASRTLNPYQH